MPGLMTRLYSAWRNNRGVQLNAADVRALLADDAIQTRTTNEIATEHGFDEPGHASMELWACNGSLKKFLRSLND